MQTPKPRSSLSEPPQKVSPQKASPRVARKLHPTALDCTSASSSSQGNKRSPKVVDHRSPRSPACEKKRPSKISELESQISQLQKDLARVKDQLCSAESKKKEAQQDAEESKNQLSATTLMLQESQKQLLELSAFEESCFIELQNISQERDEAWQSELETIQEQHKADYAALASAVNEIQQLKIQLQMVAESGTKQTDHGYTENELETVRRKLEETLCLVERMEEELKSCRESEAEARVFVSETLSQLEDAKKRVEMLGSEKVEAVKSYHSISLELDESNARVSSLEELVGKLETDLASARSNILPNADVGNEKMREENHSKEESCSLKSEIERLKSALKMAETKCHEEQIESAVHIRTAYEQVEQIKSEMNLKEANIEEELKKSRADIEELKANLMDKETELQGISEENEELLSKIHKNQSNQREYELEKEIKELKEQLADLKSSFSDQEREFHHIMEENELLKLEINKKKMIREKANDGSPEVEDTEGEAPTKLGIVMEEADKSSKNVARVSEQLEAAQAANSKLETELRRLKVQSDQWRKAAEAAATMLSAGNNGSFMDRSGSLDSNYDADGGKFNLHSYEEIDDDLLKKKNGNMLKKIGVLWKKQHK